MTIRVVSAPVLIQFTCRVCKAVNEGGPEDFEELHTMPPSFRAQCGFCRSMETCFPSALIAAAAGRLLNPAPAPLPVRVQGWVASQEPPTPPRPPLAEGAWASGAWCPLCGQHHDSPGPCVGR